MVERAKRSNTHLVKPLGYDVEFTKMNDTRLERLMYEALVRYTHYKAERNRLSGEGHKRNDNRGFQYPDGEDGMNYLDASNWCDEQAQQAADRLRRYVKRLQA